MDRHRRVRIWSLYSEAPTFDVAVDHPEEVLLGDVFKVRVTVTNGGGEELKLAL